MPSPKNDPTYVKNKEQYFMQIAKTVSLASTHPTQGGCIVVRNKDIIGSGRSLYTDSKVSIDCIGYAVAASAKGGISIAGCTVYTTRYPLPNNVFQLHLMGVAQIYFSEHEWEPIYKEDYRKAARLARE